MKHIKHKAFFYDEAFFAKLVDNLTLFFPTFPFDPLENIRKPKVFWRFQGD